MKEGYKLLLRHTKNNPIPPQDWRWIWHLKAHEKIKFCYGPSGMGPTLHHKSCTTEGYQIQTFVKDVKTWRRHSYIVSGIVPYPFRCGSRWVTLILVLLL